MSVIRFSIKNNIYPEFSNFYNSKFTYQDIEYTSVEAAFQAAKTHDMGEKRRIAVMLPKYAKRAGRRVLLRSDWEQVKYQLMCDILYCKFSQSEYLHDLLLSTGDNLIVEDTTGWHDNIWGTCTCWNCIIYEKSRNLLGRALMETRAKLRGQLNCNAECKFNDKIFKLDFYSDELRDVNKIAERAENILSNIYKYTR